MPAPQQIDDDGREDFLPDALQKRVGEGGDVVNALSNLEGGVREIENMKREMMNLQAFSPPDLSDSQHSRITTRRSVAGQSLQRVPNDHTGGSKPAEAAGGVEGPPSALNRAKAHMPTKPALPVWADASVAVCTDRCYAHRGDERRTCDQVRARSGAFHVLP